ncbi:hypothetical protein [Noviherbaspirillum galbum]|uniref:Uncharacterized protein n=1 Tax=Noviherbaspirillum galbum TaxID=2709383 RepID=A0A6B3SJX7_9BURK|nr:hypothetical protein [Noviherbaspirillum galbum]NEX59655.1 hypothetical protein [Noviherbaspirillum galbum]
MENVFIIVSDHDVPAALSAAATLERYKTFVFDPSLLDRLVEKGLSDVQYIEWPEARDYAELVRGARARASQIEGELTRAAQDFLPGGSLAGWQFLNLYYLGMAAGWYQTLWSSVARHFEGTLPHVFVCDNPSHYYWPSFVPTLSLLEVLKSRGIAFKAFQYGERPAENDLVPALFGSNAGPERCQVVAHLPTCFYDYRYFGSEIRGSGLRAMNLVAKQWGPPVELDQQVDLFRWSDAPSRLPDGLEPRAQAFAERMQAVLEQELRTCIRTDSYRHRQARHLASLMKSQFIMHGMLQAYFAGALPERLVLSDHDAGFHGPLVSFAEQHKLPVLLVPHSKITVDLEFRYRNITSLVHPMQGEPIVDAGGRSVPQHLLTYPENFTATSAFPAPLKSVGLLLNALSLNGVCAGRYRPYIDGIREIVQWARKQGISLSVRCRPGHSIIRMLEAECGLSAADLKRCLAQSMAEFANSHDLCLMYDTPTTGAIDYLRNAIPILNPVPEDLARIESCISNPRLIPRGSVGTTLELLETFASDPQCLFEFRRRQFGDYMALFAQAQPMRKFL